jgi:hypothetical protein
MSQLSQEEIENFKFPKREDGKKPLKAWWLSYTEEWIVELERNNLVIYIPSCGWYGNRLSFQDDNLVTSILSKSPHWLPMKPTRWNILGAQS